MAKYQLKFLPDALDEFKALDGSIRQKFKKLLAKRLEQPHVPGSVLHGDLKGAYKIKLRKEGFRLAYVAVVAAGKREDNEVYEAAAARVPKPQPAEKPKLKVVK